MEDIVYKIQIFEKWFEHRTKIFTQQNNGKFCDGEIIVKKTCFLNLFNRLYKRFFKHYNSRNECFCDCILLVWEGMNKFEIEDESTWERIANGMDEKNYCKLISYLKTYVTFNLDYQLYPRVLTTRTVETEDGKKQCMVFYSIEPESLNQLINQKEEKNEVVTFVKESFWNQTDEYKATVFTEWAKENLENVLNKNQIDFLRKLESANYSKLDNDYFEDEIGMNKKSIRQRLKRIYDKMTKEYQKAEKFMNGNFIIQSLNAEIKVYSKILNIVYGDCELQDLNKRVSSQILKSMNNTHFEKLVYENLNEKDLKILIRIYNFCKVADEKEFQLFSNEVSIPPKTLYRIIELVENRVEYLENKLNEENGKLKKLAIKENVKVKNTQFEVEGNRKTYYLKMNPYGIIVPKQ